MSQKEHYIKCSICNNPDRQLIDTELLIAPTTGRLRSIANKFNISYWSLRRHAINHLQISAEQAKQEQLTLLRKTMPETVKSTVEYYNAAINHFFTDPQNLDRFTGADIIKILEQRSKYIGEEQGPTRIEIRWGAGLNLDQFSKPTMTIEIPMEKLRGENKQPNEDNKEENPA